MMQCKWCGVPFDNYAVQPLRAHAGYCSVRCTTEYQEHEAGHDSRMRLAHAAAFGGMAAAVAASASRPSIPLTDEQRSRRKAVAVAFALGFVVWLAGSLGFALVGGLFIGPNFYVSVTGGFVSSFGLLYYAQVRDSDFVGRVSGASLVITVIFVLLNLRQF